jgi:aldehyde:ferredoxin oxidoreductase
MEMCGYMGKVLRVDLTNGRINEEPLDDQMLRKYVGGVGFGAKYLYEQVPPGVEWSDPENAMFIFTGPCNGTRISGSGIFHVVSKGPMNNMALSTQANGFLGAFLRFCGFDGVIIYGVANQWSYLYIHDGLAELRDARHLYGKDTWETEEAIKREIDGRCSVFCIGPAGENLVRFACLAGDRGHIASKNGVGAVMGAKKLKAIVVKPGKVKVPIKHPQRLKELSNALFDNAEKLGMGGTGSFAKWGTAGSVNHLHHTAYLPVKNYTTSIFPEHEKFDASNFRLRFKRIPTRCWACRMKNHTSIIEVTEGPYAGTIGEEPEYECVAAMGPLIWQTDPGAMIMLADLVDRLGMDMNETGWLVGWVMECYEKGLLTRDELNGLDMKWGNVEPTVTLLKQIAYRQGAGEWLAEGVKRSAEKLGGEAKSCAVYTLKGNTPRGHDHRTLWTELIDTCVSNTGTLEAAGNLRDYKQIGILPVKNRFDPIEMSTYNATINGRRQFEDCLGICLLCTHDFHLELETLNAVTGWDVDVAEAMNVGRRVANLLRVFSFRHGLEKELEAPSIRYGSAPVDGPAKGISILDHWDVIRRNYYDKMGWDPETGKPLPHTLEHLGLGHLIADLNSLK